MNTHASESDIQKYAMDKSGCPPALIAHIDSCEHCRNEVKAYQLLFSALTEQSGPAFDFDLSALVLPKLPVSRHRLSADRFVAGFLVVFVCSCVAIPVYLFRQYFLYMFSDISSFFIYAILCSVVIIIGFKTLKLYKKYQQQMRILNFN